jgi:hypothetical protein
MTLPEKCVIDTNVPKIANHAIQSDPDSHIPCKCILACIEAIEHVKGNQGLVLDEGDEIYNEYRQQLSMKGQPGVGDCFMKWVHDKRFSFQRVAITKNGDSYNEFPIHADLNNFDRSDRKFIAVANAHADKPPVLQAADSKWWGWKDALKDVGITVQFLCPEYVESKHAKKKKKKA